MEDLIFRSKYTQPILEHPPLMERLFSEANLPDKNIFSFQHNMLLEGCYSEVLIRHEELCELLRNYPELEKAFTNPHSWEIGNSVSSIIDAKISASPTAEDMKVLMEKMGGRELAISNFDQMLLRFESVLDKTPVGKLIQETMRLDKAEAEFHARPENKAKHIWSERNATPALSRGEKGLFAALKTPRSGIALAAGLAAVAAGGIFAEIERNRLRKTQPNETPQGQSRR